MAANGSRNLPGQWGKWKGSVCAWEGCDKPVVCRGYCASHYNKKRWADGVRPPSVNKGARRAAHLKYRYGITPQEYKRLFDEQGGKCAVCGEPPGDNVRAHWGGKLCVDHCHDTGKVRALLCNDCNLVVGYAKTAEVALAAADYIRLHSEKKAA